MADIHHKQRICIEFCFKLGWTQDNTYSAICHAFGNKALHSDQCREIYRESKENYKIEKFIPEDPCCTIDDICDKVGDLNIDCQKILTDDLNVASKPVPKVLTPEQKKDRLDVCRHLLACANEDPTFTSRIITGDEICVYLPDSEIMQQSKITLIVFFDIEGIVYQKIVQPNQKINADFYCDVLEQLEKAVCEGRREMWIKRNWLLHHDNAKTHTAQKTKNFLRDNNISVVRHPPNSPDLAPCDFFLFDKIKKELNKHSKHKFETVSQEVLRSLQPTDFQEAFKEWQKRWDQCIKSEGDYF